MSAPNSMEEYIRRFNENQRISGYGMETAMHYPCPFCAAPDVMAVPVLDTRPAMEKGATCAECGRSFRAIFQDGPSSLAFTLVQTGGPEQPAWLYPAMPREATHG